METSLTAGTELAALLGPRWVEIEAAALEHNVQQVKKILEPGTRLLAVVKADAYGAGAVEAARLFLKAGASYVGVTTLAEGWELRRHGIMEPVLLMSPLLPEEMATAIRQDLTLSIASRGEAERAGEVAREAGRPARVHLKIETGLNRTGLQPEEAVALAREMASWPEVQLEGVYTHLARAAHPGKTREQFRLFQETLQALEAAGVSPPLRHICNSTACLNYPEMHLDMVRVGTLLYGQFPPGARNRGLDLRDPWQLKARLLAVRRVPAGTPVGYGGDYVTSRPTYLGVLPLGYADGLGLTAIARPKSAGDLVRFVAKAILSYLGWHRRDLAVDLEGRRVPVVGRIGMQLSLVDLEDIPAEAGQVVTITMGRPITGARLPRLYLREGEPYLLRTATGEWITVSPGRTEAAPSL
ncbi:alanine racemase [Thermanaeromonas sp. C210]|uniref:alanine racemase n=1 Tax=Thermanaeromonas sp. C210 TaxID=2731925 RepID=UPI00155BBA88|nr:alanine racemase [Thermanaeromonas sp. C210]GFN22997.1 alanine racemase [Thermanaeromonas sp. C210]